MEIRLLLVDGLNLIRRVYAAQPGDDGPERVQSALVSGTQSLRRALKECNPTHAVCVLEGGGRGWRHELHPDYKASHAPMPAALEESLGEFEVSFREAGVRSFRQERMEADDVVATMAVKVADAGGTAIVLSTDKAFLQLLDEAGRIAVRDHFQGSDRDAAWVRRKFGVDPGRLAELLALAGNPTDDIPGVHGVGPKTGARLLDEHGSLEAVLEAAPDIPGKLGERLREQADAARLSHRLVRLRTDLELGVNLQELRCR